MKPVVILAALLIPLLAHAEWYRGNTHTHTINSDGNAAPDTVVRWYREHGYQFLVITDHEYLTDIEALNRLFGATERFVLIRGQEVTQRSENPQQPLAHVNAINTNQVIFPVGETQCAGGVCARIARASTPLAETFTANIAHIRAAGGLAQVNHPNYKWSVKPQDLFGVPNQTLIEIWNGSSHANNLGGTDDAGNTALSTEALWDVLLSRGQILWGVGSDDSHDYMHLDDLASTRPGRAWVMVQAQTLSTEAIVDALHAGRFYASNGVTLENIAATPQELAIAIKEENEARYITRFIGKNGVVLAQQPGLKPHYRFTGQEGYVRAAITDSNGLRAWTQPVFLDVRASGLRKKN